MTENTIDKTILIRVMILAFVVMLMFSSLIIRLWNIQVLSGREFDEKASRQYFRDIRIPAVRGRIYSSDGKLLASNLPSVEVLLHLSEMPLSGKLKKSAEYILSEIRRAGRAIGKESPVSQKDILYHMQHYPGIPMVIFKNLDSAELAKIAEITPAIPGLELSSASIRLYPYHSLAAQLIGYTGPADPSTAEDRGDYAYYLPDTVGRTGLEKSYNSYLQGKPGKKQVKVNHRGFVHEVIGKPRPAEPADDLILTLDARLQAAAERLLRGKEGAIVMMDAADGSILAAGSAPGYDLNLFIPRISTRELKTLREQEGHPFLNKVFQGTSMPGSIIKPLVALAMLENGISPDEEIECDGATYFGDGSRIRCWAWQSGGHGSLTITDAIKVSCNDFFIENGMKLGLDKLQEIYASAGIGRKTGIDLPENPGILPNRQRWKNWNIYDTALISIGQGKIQVSPIQAVSYAAAIANGGTLWKPRLVKEIRNPESGKHITPPPVSNGRLKASPENIAIVREGMYRAVNEYGGGARRAELQEFIVSGKTGTAEVGPKDQRTKNTWFIGFAELPSGRLTAVAVLIFKGEAGNKTAAPLAAEMFRYAAKLNL